MLAMIFTRKLYQAAVFFCTGNFFCHLLSTSIFFLCLMLLYVQTKDKKMWAWNSLCATFLLHHYFRYKQLFLPQTYLLAFLTSTFMFILLHYLANSLPFSLSKNETKLDKDQVVQCTKGSSGNWTKGICKEVQVQIQVTVWT